MNLPEATVAALGAKVSREEQRRRRATCGIASTTQRCSSEGQRLSLSLIGRSNTISRSPHKTSSRAEK
jgi:hypothetical protein